MAPFWVLILSIAGFVLLALLLHNKSERIDRIISTLFSNKLGGILVNLLCIFLIVALVLSIPDIVNRFYNLDRVRHIITDKRHPISQDDIIRSLNFDFEKYDESVDAIEGMVQLYSFFDQSSSEFRLDTLISKLSKSNDFETGFDVYQTVSKLTIPQKIKDYCLDKTFKLAKNKYETIKVILFTSYIRKDLDKVLSVYELVKNWKWDRNIFNESIKNDTHAADRNYTIALSMLYAIQLLEDSSEKINDSIAKTIFEYSTIGAGAATALYGDSFNPNVFIFLDKRAQYAYQLNDPKADKYADEYILRTQRSPFFSNHYHYLIFDRGSDIEGYQNRFFTDPLFLRYKSCLKQKKYKKARDLLNIIQSNTTDEYQDPIKPYYQLHDSIQFVNRSVLDIALPYAKYDLATISENARLRYLTHKEDFDKWATGSYLTGAWYLSPTEGISYHTIDCLFDKNEIPANEITSYIAVNYNNTDPRWVYNTALYLKGATTKISGAIEGAIRESNNDELIDNLKAIKREHVFSSALDTTDQRYVALNDSVEMMLGSKMKETLSECFYSFVDIKDGLSDNECAIEIVQAPSLSFGEDVYKAVILRKDWKEPTIIKLANNGVINESIISGNYYSSASSKLYSIIWKPLEKHIKPNDTIFLASDGALSLVNLTAILNDKGQRLSEIYDIRQCVSTKTVMDKQRPETHQSIALFGGMNYDETSELKQASTTSRLSAYRSSDSSYRDSTFLNLPGTDNEVKTISEQAQKDGITSLLYAGEDGSEYNFKDLTGKDINIIHVATHGFYYNAPSTRELTFFEKISVKDNPLNRCGLIFSGGNKAWKGEVIPDNQEDGILLGSEIARMDLSGTDLVVLSACNTGLGDISEEGVVGLQMAFKRAGVKSLLLTLSKVEDEATSFFMTNFYEHLFGGEDKHSAYKAAINTMRSSERFSDPKYWSPFILVD